MIHIVTKAEPTQLRENLLRGAFVCAALAASMIVIFLMGYNPFEVFAKIVQGSLGTAYRFRETVHKAIPLAVLSLGIIVAFRMKFWNIGGEGQFYLGAFGASLAAFAFPSLPSPLLLPLMAIFAFAFAAFWALIPALLRARFRASETLVTLMLNYVAALWISYLQYGPWKDPAVNGFPKIAPFADSAVLPRVLGIHIGLILTIILMILLHIMIKKTKLGYEIDVLGESEATARYAGINVNRVLFTAVALSGGLCGFAGMMQASAIERSLSDQLSGGLGFTAVITSWLARLNAPAACVVSLLFSMLLQGGSFLQSSLKIPASMSQILQGIIIFFVLGSEFFVRYRFVSGKTAGGKNA